MNLYIINAQTKKKKKKHSSILVRWNGMTKDDTQEIQRRRTQ